MYKASSIIRVCAWAFIAILLLAVLFSNLGGGSLFSPRSDARNTPARADGASLEAKPIRKLTVEWVAGSVDVSFYDGDTIQFSESANAAIAERDRLYYEIKGDTLTINFYQSTNVFSFFRTGSKALRVEIPRAHSLEALTINGVSADVTVDGGETQIEKVDLSTVSGAINLLRMDSQRLALETVSGEMSASGGFNRVSSESVSGGAALRLSRMPDSLKCTSVSGHVELMLPDNSGFTAKLDSLSGSLRTDFAQPEGKQKAVYGDGRIKLNFETVSGNVTLTRIAPLPVPTAEPMPEAPALPELEDGDNRLSVPSGSREF